MTIKVPVSEITMGTQQGNAIVDLHTEEVLGRLSMPAAKEAYPDFEVVDVARKYTEKEVDEAALLQLLNASAN